MTSRRYRLGVLDGDGIGPEIVAATRKVVDAAAEGTELGLDWVALPFGAAAIDEYGEAVPGFVLDELDSCDGWVLGPHDSASYAEPHRRRLNPSGTIRRHFDLYANVRPARTLAEARTPAVDLVVVRENTEGFYADRNTYAGSGEWMPTADVAVAHGVFTRAAISRIARVACELAAARRGHLTIVHKANVLPLTSGLFLDVCRSTASDLPELEVEDLHVDAMTVHLVRRPEAFDVIVTENMFGDILSDLAGEICGSLGLSGSINFGDRHAMAQAAHGSAPELAGLDLANPAGLMFSAAQLLDRLGVRAGDSRLNEAARLVAGSVEATLASGETTADLGGTLGTSEFSDSIARHIRQF